MGGAVRRSTGRQPVRVGGPSRGTVIGEADSAGETIALVEDGLPADCGPAVAGTAPDLRRP
ncbi:DUF6193 family natural product biosynthesis protein [Streptomyces sp. MTZ3.1]|uniref:DUF6193 family natural product biosynthesis protein n=1 Tax=Streptomyces meridianus TaxID=2938945 RepID=A0ABT0X854_9ACTN|nr:DUF6193 family natural product biosynthesis protein [Streptomyces meridianus]MCM2578712.1 DUF6193 family natural product biosynthesis protein [Streptomyces meridianus]